MKKTIILLSFLLLLSANVYSEEKQEYDIYFKHYQSDIMLKLTYEEKKIVKKYIDADKKELMKIWCPYRLILVDNEQTSYYKTSGTSLAKIGNDLFIKFDKDMDFIKKYISQFE